ncbi:hypothetical protein [Flavobacterium difficile]|uniref:Uncharacterized protein n=1 Tax=Flavobacterium difficile TaxID=2709659 RepID=A0ABX0I1R4_9FLAO|nr:hypothetical protein [Flavobacterium difficile]NHM01134.1 hypothetical protein [Flavobacterium difficile]
MSRFISFLKIYWQLLQSFSVSRSEQTTIIVCFDGSVSHGGLLDRLKGVISFYEVAKIKQIDFKIYFNHPFQLSDFLQPNAVNWKLETLQFNPFQDEVLYLMNNFSVNPLALIDAKKNKKYFIYCNIDYLKNMHQDFSDATIQETWRTNYNQLFTESPILKEAIFKLPQEKNIVCHTRFTSLMGDFADTTSVILNASEKENLVQKIIEKINNIQQQHSNLPIYVLSDSLVFLDAIKATTNFNTLSGTPKHVDVKSTFSSFEEHLKTFTDFYFISKSEQVFLLKIDQMYSSGFSKYAAIIGNKPFTIIE